KQVTATLRRCGEEILENRKLGEGFAEGYKLAGRRQTQSDATGQALEVENAAEILADFAADYRLLNKMLDRVEAGVDGVAIDEWAKNPGAEESSAHAGDRGVQSGNEGSRAGARGFLGEDGMEE